MGKEIDAYVVCAKLHGADASSSKFDEVLAGQPVVRRLNRMERVALGNEGKLVRRTRESLLMSFGSANSAIISACEMQHRCAGLPQVSACRLILQIGIHKAAPESQVQTSLAATLKAERRDRKRRFGFDEASRLAGISTEDGVVVSSLVYQSLDPAIRQACQPIRTPSGDIPAHRLDWRADLSFRSSLSIPDLVSKRALQKLVLRHGSKRLELDQMNSVTTIGRDPGCDVMISDRFASRIHAHIEIRPEGCFLTDQSVNGTSVLLQNGLEVLVKGKSFLLSNKGRLSFGHSVNDDTGDVLKFELVKN